MARSPAGIFVQTSAAALLIASVGRTEGMPVVNSAAKTYTIVIEKMAFGSAPADLKVGDTVLWINHDLFQHTATAADKSFDVDLPPGKSARTILKREGVIAFACRYHPGMKGKLSIGRRP